MSERIGKDNIRILALSDFQRRIEELKSDSERSEQEPLIRGIYVLREICLKNENNVFLINEKQLQTDDTLRQLVYRLMDYRIIHNLGNAYTHKSHPGTFQAFMIDIGFYAHLRKLSGRFYEIDLFDREAKERIRTAPVVDKNELKNIWKSAPTNVEEILLRPGE